jgi:hypothetical protein
MPTAILVVRFARKKRASGAEKLDFSARITRRIEY